MTTRISQNATSPERKNASAVSSYRPRAIETVELVVSLKPGVGVHTVTVPGADVGDIVIASPTTSPHDSVASWAGFVSSKNTVTIRLLIIDGPGGSANQEFRVAVIGS